jgi:hypothetical protein
MISSMDAPLQRRRTGPWARAFGLLALLALAGCDGTALVTLTATPATVTGFLSYRVMLDSVALQGSSGGSAQSVLPAGVSVDLAQAASLTEILSASTVPKGTYTSATVTVDYTDAVIVADDGSQSGKPLTAQDANGQSIGQVTLTLTFDPSNPVVISKDSTSQLALGFQLSASNNVNLAAGTVTVTPVLVASSLPIDTKTLRLRGPVSSTSGVVSSTTDSTAVNNYTTGIEPFDGLVSESGSVSFSPTATTVFEVNGTPSIGTAGFNALAALGSGAWTVSYGTLTSSTTTTSDATQAAGASVANAASPVATTTTTTTSVSFTPTQVWAGSSVQGGGLDRISGVVTARSGNSLTVPAATWITSAGGESFVSGAATITLGDATAVTLPGQDGAQSNTLAQISVGSWIDAFGSASSLGTGSVALDATSGRVRLENTVASGLVTVQGTDALTIDLYSLGGRSVEPFNFAGTGGASGTPSNPAQYQVTTGALDLLNSIVGSPVQLTGLTGSYGSVPPDFAATSLLDTTTINAEAVIDLGSGGSSAPFTALSSSEIDLPAASADTNGRHQIAVGAQVVDVQTLASDLLIEPSTATTLVFCIAHASTSTVENFNTFAAFIAQLQSELNGTTLVNTITADGVYTAAGTTFAATSVTVYLNI